MSTQPNIAFFGTPDFAVWVLDALKEKGIVPNLIVAAPDAPKGRKLVMTPPPTKVWAEAHNVPVIQPENIKTTVFDTTWDLFIVAAYGKILPETILNIPKHKTINVHPSLLPLLRGSSPLQSAILNDMRETGVTIMRLDKEMDHGPILAQKKTIISPWPIDHIALGKTLARDGAYLIAEILPSILDNTLPEIEQEHSKATYTKKISKQDGEINLSEHGYKNFLKYNAYKEWPGSYFFDEAKDGSKKIRITITEATYKDDTFVIQRVIPEGKKEMSWEEYRRFIA